MSTTQQIPLTLENVILKGCISWRNNPIHPWQHWNDSHVEVTGPLHVIAAEIEKAYLLIPRADLPKTDVVERVGQHIVEVDGAGTWRAEGDPAKVRQIALEYLAAAEAITAHQASAKAAEAEDAKKLDEEARELREVILGGVINDPHEWHVLPEGSKESYRRAARKARELHQPKS